MCVPNLFYPFICWWSLGCFHVLTLWIVLLWTCVCVHLVAQPCLTLCNSIDSNPPSSSVHRDSPGKNTGMGCHALLQGIFPTQGLNQDLLHCRWFLYQLNYQGSPAVNIGVIYLFELWLSADVWPGVGLLDHMVALFLGFYGTSILFSTVAVQTYILTNSVGGFPFIHTLSNIFYL